MTDWQKIAEQRAAELEDAKKELADYVESSGLLEQELEEEVKQLQKKLKEEKTRAMKLEQERDTLKSKATEANSSSRTDLARLQAEVAQLRTTLTEQTTKMRDLEQKNDQFEEAAHRATAMVDGLESQVNQRIEENAFLRTDLEEQAAVIQHLKEELRDTKSELEALRTRSPDATSPERMALPNGNMSSSHTSPVRQTSSTATDVATPAKDRVAAGTQTDWVVRIVDVMPGAEPSPARPSSSSSTAIVAAAAATPAGRPVVPAVAALSGTAAAFSSAFTTPLRGLPTSKLGISPMVAGSAGRATPSRAAALTMVSELLQRITSLESKLVTCHATTTTSRLNTSTVVPRITTAS
eukprot:m.177294 g.177294  ORF g.177294 m.177294 type:complete len:353 (-) comp17377_c0_seq1:4280-5338(-)